MTACFVYSCRDDEGDEARVCVVDDADSSFVDE